MLFFLLNSLSKIHAFYQFSLNAFVTVFGRGLDNAPGGRRKPVGLGAHWDLAAARQVAYLWASLAHVCHVGSHIVWNTERKDNQLQSARRPLPSTPSRTTARCHRSSGGSPATAATFQRSWPWRAARPASRAGRRSWPAAGAPPTCRYARNGVVAPSVSAFPLQHLVIA